MKCTNQRRDIKDCLQHWNTVTYYYITIGLLTATGHFSQVTNIFSAVLIITLPWHCIRVFRLLISTLGDCSCFSQPWCLLPQALALTLTLSPSHPLFAEASLIGFHLYVKHKGQTTMPNTINSFNSPTGFMQLTCVLKTWETASDVMS